MHNAKGKFSQQMAENHLTINEEYWNSFSLQESDFEYIFNYLIEEEIPKSSIELLKTIIEHRIESEIASLEKRHSESGTIYTPQQKFKIGEKIILPQFGWAEAKIINIRPGINPDFPPFEVIEIESDDAGTISLASGIDDHLLNQAPLYDSNDTNYQPDFVLNTYKKQLLEKFELTFRDRDDLVQIAGRWFPRALLIEINSGYLNLAEAILDMESGGPLKTKAILEQMDLPSNENPRLIEFSLNFALQEDERFDEVGPSGEILWFLKRLEPEAVKKLPALLRDQSDDYNHDLVIPLLEQVSNQIYDELEEYEPEFQGENSFSISLIYPHWKVGTLPLTKRISNLFPTAHEAPRVRFTFVDVQQNKKFPGWVVRPQKIVYGLKEWYESRELIPGCIVNVKRGENAGEVEVWVEKRKSSHDWIRTAIIGADGGIVFATTKQLVPYEYHDQMVIAVSGGDVLDNIWTEEKKFRQPLETTITSMMKELGKLNPQGHVHAQELYAAVNLVKRCPPGAVLTILESSRHIAHIGDQYYRLKDTSQEE